MDRIKVENLLSDAKRNIERALRDMAEGEEVDLKDYVEEAIEDLVLASDEIPEFTSSEE